MREPCESRASTGRVRIKHQGRRCLSVQQDVQRRVNELFGTTDCAGIEKEANSRRPAGGKGYREIHVAAEGAEQEQKAVTVPVPGLLPKTFDNQ